MIRKYLFLIIYGFCMFALYAKDENLDKTSIVSQTVAVICIVGTIIVGIQQSEEKIEELENNLEILSMKLNHYILRSDTLDVKDIQSSPEGNISLENNLSALQKEISLISREVVKTESIKNDVVRNGANIDNILAEISTLSGSCRMHEKELEIYIDQMSKLIAYNERLLLKNQGLLNENSILKNREDKDSEGLRYVKQKP